MFTWICPKCGREVPPAYTDCPDCSKDAPPVDAAAPVAAPPQAAHNTPSPAPPPQQYAAAPPPYQAPATARGGLPTWAMALLFAFAFLGLGSGVYWLVGASHGASAKPATTIESPAAKPGAKTSPYQKYIEISGVRFVEGPKKKIQVRFIITNHSGADLPTIGGNVTIWGRTRNAEEDAAGTFTFKTDLKGFESKDLTVPLTTKKEFIELPDWQNVSTDVQVTSPE
jgi:hypothetical protein